MKVKDCFGFTIRSLNRRVSQLYDEMLRPLGLTIGQLNVLHVVKIFQPIAQQELSEKLAMEKSTISREVEKLRQRAWVTFGAHADQRKKMVQLTPEGEALLQHVFPLWEATQQKATDLLPPQALEQLQKMLQHFASQA